LTLSRSPSLAATQMFFPDELAMAMME
jgi:hypothetical protein